LKGTGALLFSGEEYSWSTVLKRTDSTLLFLGEGNRWLLFSGERNCWSTVLKRTGTLMFSGEENRRKP